MQYNTGRLCIAKACLCLVGNLSYYSVFFVKSHLKNWGNLALWWWLCWVFFVALGQNLGKIATTKQKRLDKQKPLAKKTA